MFRPDEANNLVQQPPREPQVAAEVLGFRANCEMVTKERVVAENGCGKRGNSGRQLEGSRKYWAKPVSALNFYGHCSPRY